MTFGELRHPFPANHCSDLYLDQFGAQLMRERTGKAAIAPGVHAHRRGSLPFAPTCSS